MADEKKRAEKIASDWFFLDLVIDDSSKTKELDKFVNDSYKNIDSKVDYIMFLKDIGSKLTDLQNSLGPETLKNTGEHLNNFRREILKEFESYGAKVSTRSDKGSKKSESKRPGWQETEATKPEHGNVQAEKPTSPSPKRK